MQIPKDFETRMRSMLGSDYPAFAAALSSPEQNIGLRIVRPAARPLVLSRLGYMDPVVWCPDGFYTDKSKISGSHPYHIAGLVYFQEPSAMAPAEALDIQPGDRVLDLCAAPGGKATQAGAKLQGQGLLVANEIIPRRAQVLAENITRCGIPNCIVSNEVPERLAARFPGFFNKIIVDAPCSGEGMFRKEPQAIAEWSLAHTQSCARRQTRILDCAAEMLAPGGKMVYSTCTFAPCENEGVIDSLLASNPALSLAESGLTGLSPGNGAWAGSMRDLSGTRRVFPHLQRGEGHFIAVLQKNGTDVNPTPPLRSTAPPADYRTFEQQALKIRLDGGFQLFGDHLYLVPANIQGLKVVRAGLYLGICKKGRFEPSHALALACRQADFQNTLNFSADDPSLAAFLHGETLSCAAAGWTAVCVDGFPIGWGKAAGGILKNHFPKALRL